MERNERFAAALDYLYKNGIVTGQKELSEKTGISEVSISRILNNRVKKPSDETLRRLNLAFGNIFNPRFFRCESDELLSNEDAIMELDAMGKRKKPIADYLGEPTYEPRPGSIPLIPIDAMAGIASGDGHAIMPYECEHYIVPVFRGVDFLIQVSGDSMMPRYTPGDIVACKKVPLGNLWFQWGRTYVLDTTQGALIKRIEPATSDGCITLHSDNSRYAPFTIPTTDINAIALVIGTIRVE